MEVVAGKGEKACPVLQKGRGGGALPDLMGSSPWCNTGRPFSPFSSSSALSSLYASVRRPHSLLLIGAALPKAS